MDGTRSHRWQGCSRQHCTQPDYAAASSWVPRNTARTTIMLRPQRAQKPYIGLWGFPTALSCLLSKTSATVSTRNIIIVVSQKALDGPGDVEAPKGRRNHTTLQKRQRSPEPCYLTMMTSTVVNTRRKWTYTRSKPCCTVQNFGRFSDFFLKRGSSINKWCYGTVLH